MIGLTKSDDYQPVGWVGRYPIHVATLLVLVHVLTMIATALAEACGQMHLLAQLMYSSSDVLDHFRFWQFLTYAFVNPPSIWFAVEMFLLFSFGREVEKFIGRRSFIAFYVTLLLLPPCLLTAIGTFWPLDFAGSSVLHFAVFVGFAAVYPNVELLFTIKAKWVAAVLLAIYTLQALAGHGWTLLIVLWASTLAAFTFIARLRYGVDFSPLALLNKLKRTPKMSPPLARRNLPKKAPDEDAVESIDPLLEKISAQGLASLTPKEREKLERIRRVLLQKSAR